MRNRATTTSTGARVRALRCSAAGSTSPSSPGSPRSTAPRRSTLSTSSAALASSWYRGIEAPPRGTRKERASTPSQPSGRQSLGLIASGAVALGAFNGDRLVGIGVVLAHLRPGVAQLAYLHVSDGFRGRGIGARLCDELEGLAREAGDTSMVVSATPSYNTVGFYRRRGYEPMAEPFPELYDLEPEDVHMTKLL